MKKITILSILVCMILINLVIGVGMVGDFKEKALLEKCISDCGELGLEFHGYSHWKSYPDECTCVSEKQPDCGNWTVCWGEGNCAPKDECVYTIEIWGVIK